MSSNNYTFNFRDDGFWFNSEAPQDTREAHIRTLLEEFKKRFPTRAACLQELCKHNFTYNEAGHLQCPYCQFPKEKIDYNKRAFRCKKCKRKIWLTAGTFFHKSKKPEAWLAIIWFIEAGLILSSLHFHTILGIAQSTAWTMLQTILQAVRMQLEASEEWSELAVDDTADITTLISSAAFLEVFIKRSLETPKREHPSTEEEEHAKEAWQAAKAEHGENTQASTESPANASSEEVESPGQQETREKAYSQFSGKKLNIEEQQIFDLLADNKPQHINYICRTSGLSMSKTCSILTMLELQQLIKRLPGDLYERNNPEFSTIGKMQFSSQEKADQKVQKEKDVDITKFRQFIKHSFHGISRKYLQSYIAAFWTQISPLWQNSYLLKACQQLEPISYKQIQLQVSPLKVHFPC